jgi:hypothetical protein
MMERRSGTVKDQGFIVKAFLSNRVDGKEWPPLYYKFVMIRQANIHDLPTLHRATWRLR